MSSPYLVINASNKYYDIYDMNTGKKMALLYPREAFIVIDNEGVIWNIKIRNSAGKIVNVVVHDKENFIGDNCKSCYFFPYSKEIIDGREYETYLMRKAKKIYTPSADYWGGVGQNMLVASNNDIVGETHSTWKAIDYVKRSTDGKWVKVSGQGYNYGFVETGLEDGSMYNNIPFYGSW